MAEASHLLLVEHLLLLVHEWTLEWTLTVGSEILRALLIVSFALHGWFALVHLLLILSPGTLFFFLLFLLRSVWLLLL